MNKRWMTSFLSVFIIGGVWLIFFSPLSIANDDSLPKYSGIVQQGEYDLSFKIGGRIAQLEVDEGDLVTEGQLLGQLEIGEWQAKVDQAKAAVELAQAHLDKALRSVGLTEQDGLAKIKQAETGVHMAQAKYEALLNGARKEEIAQFESKVELAQESFTQAEEHLVRMNSLFEQGAIPQAKVDEAKLHFEQAKTQLRTAQLSLDLALAGARPEELEAARQQVEQARATLQEALNGSGKVDLSQADVRLATAQYHQALAGLAEAETYLSYTNLYTPVDGLVSVRYVQESEMVSSGLSALTIVDPSDKWVLFYISEHDIPYVETNQEVLLYLPALDKQVVGRVVFINPAPQFAVKKATNYLGERDIRSFAVKVQLMEDLKQIYAGMTADWLGVN